MISACRLATAMAVALAAAWGVAPAIAQSPDPAAESAAPESAEPEGSAPGGGGENAAPAGGAIPQLRFGAPAAWVKVEVIDNVTGGCFLSVDEAQGYAERQIREAGQSTTGDEEVFHVVFRIRATGDRMRDGQCFGAIFFEELYPIDVAVSPGAEPYRSRWPGRLGLQKLVIDEEAFDREVFQVIDDGVGILFRER